MIVSWFSAGVSSAVATKMALQKYQDIRIIYTHIDDQHDDTLRFIADCEKWFDHEIEILHYPEWAANRIQEGEKAISELRERGIIEE